MMKRWAVFQRWRDEPQGGGDGWKPVFFSDSISDAEAEYERLRKEDKESGNKMNFAIEDRG